jgi:MFS family permease
VPNPFAGLGANYVRLWGASTVSSLGDGVTLAALPLLAASLSRDPLAVAGVALASQLPWLIFPLIAGALVDRLDRRRVMASVDVARMVILGLLAAFVLADLASLSLLYGLGFLLGTAETLFDNAAQSVMPAVVERDQLERANARLYTSEIVLNEIAGPPLGALLFTVAGALPFMVDAASFGAAAGLILLMAGTFRAGARNGGPLLAGLGGDISEGLRWLWRHRLLRTLGILLGVQHIVWTATNAILVLFALETLGLSELGFALLLVVGAVGGIAGSLVAPRVSAGIGPGTALVGAILVPGIALVAIGVAADVYVTATLVAVFGFAAVVWNVITVSLRQSIVPGHLLGRVNSAYRLLGWGPMPFGALLGGVLARELGLRTPFIVGGALQVAIALAVIPILTNAAIARARTRAA